MSATMDRATSSPVSGQSVEQANSLILEEKPEKKKTKWTAARIGKIALVAIAFAAFVAATVGTAGGTLGAAGILGVAAFGTAAVMTPYIGKKFHMYEDRGKEKNFQDIMSFIATSGILFMGGNFLTGTVGLLEGSYPIF
ncbi:MAG: hypothetical protein ACI9YB_000093 [Halioglobus sp.]|jgi:hypothetical protein